MNSRPLCARTLASCCRSLALACAAALLCAAAIAAQTVTGTLQGTVTDPSGAIVPGATITKKQAAKADGAELTTAQGGTVTVKVSGKKVTLKDADPNDANPRIVAFNVNLGNKQIGHGINRVLRPLDL